jgi:hypothetical protein
VIMEKKISVGIITVAMVDFIIVFIILFSFFALGPGSKMQNIRNGLRYPLIHFVYGFCFSLPVLIAGVSTMRFRRLGRRLNIFISVFFVLVNLIAYFNRVHYSIYELVPILFSMAIFVFLFLPKVKEKFK